MAMSATEQGPLCTTRSYAITSIVVSDFESKRSNFVSMGRKSVLFRRSEDVTRLEFTSPIDRE